MPVAYYRPKACRNCWSPVNIEAIQMLLYPSHDELFVLLVEYHSVCSTLVTMHSTFIRQKPLRAAIERYESCSDLVLGTWVFKPLLIHTTSIPHWHAYFCGSTLYQFHGTGRLGSHHHDIDQLVYGIPETICRCVAVTDVDGQTRTQTRFIIKLGLKQAWQSLSRFQFLFLQATFLYLWRRSKLNFLSILKWHHWLWVTSLISKKCRLYFSIDPSLGHIE